MPQYLWNRPKQVVSHCRASITKAEDIPLKDVAMSSEGKFSIKRQTEKGYYELTFGNNQEPPACQCLSWQRTRLPCKHFFAVFRHYPNWQWDQLSPSYINGPRLTLDEVIITTPGLDDVTTQAIPCSKEMRTEEELDTIHLEGEKEIIKPAEEQCAEKPAQAEKKRRKCRDRLAELRNITYLIQEKDALSVLEEHLHRVLTLTKKFVPSDEGLNLKAHQLYYHVKGPNKVAKRVAKRK